MTLGIDEYNLNTNARGTPLEDLSVWENPYYFFRISNIDTYDETDFKECIIDVTASAWATKLSKDHSNVLKILLSSNSGYNINSVLDYGSGKLATLRYLIQKEKKVTFVDFKEVKERYPEIKSAIEKYEGNEYFDQLQFPIPFLEDNHTFDLSLLFNVLPVMPVFLERLLVLQVLWRKIRNNKYLLWLAMKKPTRYRERETHKSTHLGDGIWIGKGDFKTFYKYHNPNELILLTFLSGFQLERLFKSSSNNIILFRKSGMNFLQDIISEEFINERSNWGMRVDGEILVPISTSSDQITPYPDEFDLFNIAKMTLLHTHPGTNHAERFKYLIAGFIRYIFSPELKNMTLEDPVDDGLGIIDISFQREGRDGFFGFLKKEFENIHGPMVFIECKNLSERLRNEHYNQLYSRFNQNRGNFGFLICRDKFDETEVLRHVKANLNNGYIIVLDDEDIINLLKLRTEDDNESIKNYCIDLLKNIIM